METRTLGLILFTFLLTGFIFGLLAGNDVTKWRAVRNNAAHYILNEDNDKEFKWGPKPKN